MQKDQNKENQSETSYIKKPSKKIEACQFREPKKKAHMLQQAKTQAKNTPKLTRYFTHNFFYLILEKKQKNSPFLPKDSCPRIRGDKDE